MAKTTGPLFSISASGSIGNLLTFAKSSGRNICKRYGKPTGEATSAQLSIRNLTRFLTQLWPTLSSSDQSTWDELAASTAISPANAFFRYNHKRWQSLKGLTSVYPASNASYSGYFIELNASTAGELIRLAPLLEGGVTPYLCTILRSPSPITVPRPNQLSTIIILPRPDELELYDSPPSAGTWYYRMFMHDLTGRSGPMSFQVSATI